MMLRIYDEKPTLLVKLVEDREGVFLAVVNSDGTVRSKLLQVNIDQSSGKVYLRRCENVDESIVKIGQWCGTRIEI